MDTPITRAEHKEFCKRMEDEHHRTNRRLTNLETEFERNNKLLISVEKLAMSMENMQREQIDQGKRLEELESRDGEMWRKATGYVVTTIISLVLGFIFAQIM